MDEHTRDPSVGPPRAGTDPAGWREDGRWEHATLRRATVHGVRLFNSGAYHPAHDCFEDQWFNYAAGSVESTFCHAMVQVAAGAYKRERDELDGMRSLFRTALGYLDGVPADFYGLDVAAVRRDAAAALDDPAAADGLELALDGRSLTATDADYAYAERAEAGET